MLAAGLLLARSAGWSGSRLGFVLVSLAALGAVLWCQRLSRARDQAGLTGPTSWTVPDRRTLARRRDRARRLEDALHDGQVEGTDRPAATLLAGERPAGAAVGLLTATMPSGRYRRSRLRGRPVPHDGVGGVACGRAHDDGDEHRHGAALAPTPPTGKARLMDQTDQLDEPGSVVGSLRPPVPPLLRWVSPTRGYVAVAVIAGVVLLVAGVAWQSWLLVRDGSSSGGAGWSVASMTVLAVAVVVLVEFSRRPQPRAAGPRDRARQARARTLKERRIVRRAMWLGRLPVQRRLQRAAAHRLEPAAGNVVLVPLYLLFGAASLGFAATHGDQASTSAPALMGVLWTGGSLLLLGMLGWLRRQATRLQQAWEAADTTKVTDTTEVNDTADPA